MGTENYEDKDHDQDHDPCRKVKEERDAYKKERDEYKKERDEFKKERDEWKKAACEYKKERDQYKDFLHDALDRLGVAVRKLNHLLDDIGDASRKIGKRHEHHHDRDHDHDHGKHCA